MKRTLLWTLPGLFIFLGSTRAAEATNVTGFEIWTTSTTAYVAWSTDILCSYYLSYSGGGQDLASSDNNPTLYRAVLLTGLLPNTTYSYTDHIIDTAGNHTHEVGTFQTTSEDLTL